MSSSSVESYAISRITHSVSGSDENRTSGGKLHLRPYFGHLSGIWISFEVRKGLDSGRNCKIKVKIEGCRTSSLCLYLRCDLEDFDITKSVSQAALKDTCLKYAHRSELPTEMSMHRPRSLAFLCEKMVLLNLNELDPSVLPPVAFSHLNPDSFPTQNVFFKVWYGSSSRPTQIIRMKVKQGILVAELKWMLCSKLPMHIEPSNIGLYEYIGTEKISESSCLTLNQAMFHCVVLSSIERDSIVVSLVGKDIKEIRTNSSMTLDQFQDRVKEKFGLNSYSFVYIPTIYRNKNVSQCNQVTMTTLLDKSTLSLIDVKRRNLPIVDGIPLNMLKCERLKMYKLKISDLDLHSSSLVYAFEVTGPTIPMSYRTTTSVGKGEFALVSDGPHAVSINLTWSVRTLLKYIEEISCFPCGNMVYGGSILPHTVKLHVYFSNHHWKTKINSSNKVEFITEVPKIVNSTVLL